MNRKSIFLLTLIVLPFVLAGCGTTTQDRGLSGAGIGAAGGAVIGAVTGVGPVGGALVGAAVGGATGALTEPSQVDLGKPAWRTGGQSSSAPPPPAPAQSASVAPTASYDSTTVRNIQGGLQRLGYDPGATDGQFGAKTESAIRRYQQDNSLPVDGQPSGALWDQIRSRIQG